MELNVDPDNRLIVMSEKPGMALEKRTHLAKMLFKVRPSRLPTDKSADL